MQEKKRKAKWKPILLVKIYRLVRLGIPEREMCQSLGFTRKSLWTWQQQFPELKEAIQLARKELSEGESLPSWMYNQLSPELKALWENIQEWGSQEGGQGRIELMLQDHGKRARQQLFLYALCLYKFSASKAMKKVNITKKELDFWISTDPQFAELVSEVQWHKGNFYEEALVQLVKEKNPAAVLFANRTFNRDRGYSARTEVDVNVSGSVLHGVMDLSELIPYLTPEAKANMLEAIRKVEESKRPVPSLTFQEKISQQILDAVK